MFKVIVIDDEKEIIELIRLYLEKDNYNVIEAYDGEMAINVIDKEKPDIAIVDIMMPKINGYQLIKMIRENYKFPVIMISAKSDYSDKIIGLELGADDYIAKPFNPLELCARVKAQLRRVNEFSEVLDEASTINDILQITVGDLTLDIEKCVLFKRGEEIELTSTEFKILNMLMENPERVYTKQQIYEAIWNEPCYGDENVIVVHMSKLRDKIDDSDNEKSFIKTIRGLGYKLNKINI